jgi:hypothetical protein
MTNHFPAKKKPGGENCICAYFTSPQLNSRVHAHALIFIGLSESSIRREDIINKAFPLDQKITSEQIRQRRKILGIYPIAQHFSIAFSVVML